MTCDPHSPSMTARARRGPAVPHDVRTQRGPRAMSYRELGKLPPTARSSRTIQFNRRSGCPLVTVDYRCGPLVRARGGMAREKEQAHPWLRARRSLGPSATLAGAAGPRPLGVTRSRRHRLAVAV
jgi:hypothetical protein